MRNWKFVPTIACLAVLFVGWLSGGFCQAQSEIAGFTLSDQTGPMPPVLVISSREIRGFVNPDFDTPNYSHLLQYQSTPARPSDKIDPPQSMYDRQMSHARAGFSLCQSRRASLTYDQQYMGYHVGGGVPAGLRTNPLRGEARYENEGTWGVDYAPRYSRVASLWSHGRLYQGGIGQYEPDHKNRPFGQTRGQHFGIH